MNSDNLFSIKVKSQVPVPNIVTSRNHLDQEQKKLGHNVTAGLWYLVKMVIKVNEIMYIYMSYSYNMLPMAASVYSILQPFEGNDVIPSLLLGGQ